MPPMNTHKIANILSFLVFIFYLSTGLTDAGAADKKDMKQALRLYRQGRGFFQKAEYRAAIEKYKQSFALSNHPNNLYYIGESYRRLGQIRKSYQYYEQYSETLSGKAREEFVQKLENLRFSSPCMLSIATSPSEAQVRIDGTVQGQTPRDGSPLIIQVAGGKHQLVVEKEGHFPFSQQLMAEFGEPIALSFSLKPSGKPPILQVESNVQGADVILDGERICSTPLRVKLEPGKHYLLINKDGYRSVERTIEAKQDAVLQVTINLIPLFPVSEKKPKALETPIESRKSTFKKSAFFIYGILGPAFVDYGNDFLSSGAAIELGFKIGYYWRGKNIGLDIDATGLYTPVTDQTGTTEIRSSFFSLLWGLGMRVFLKQDVWMGLRFAVGPSFLSGTNKDSFFFRDPQNPDKLAHVSGIFTNIAIRPEVTLGWEVHQGLTFLLSPIAIDYSPRLKEFNPYVNQIYRYHFALGLGWQY